MRLNQKTIPHKKLIKVKKNWLIVPLISIVLNSSVLVHASDSNTRLVHDDESFLNALKNKDVHSIYLKSDVTLKNQSLINDIPRRNLTIDLSDHRLDWSGNEWQFVNDSWETLSQINVQFVNGYLNADEIDRMKKTFNDEDSQVHVELDHIKTPSVNDHVDVSNGSNTDNSSLPDANINKYPNENNVIKDGTAEVWTPEASTNVGQNSNSQITVTSDSVSQSNEDKISHNEKSSTASTSWESESSYDNSSNTVTSKSTSVINSQAGPTSYYNNTSSASSSSFSNAAHSASSKSSDTNTLISKQSFNNATNNVNSSNTSSSLDLSSNSKLNNETSLASSQNNDDSLSNKLKLLDYFNLITPLRGNQSSNSNSKGDFNQSLAGVLQSLNNNQNNLNNRLKTLEINQSHSQSSSSLNDKTKPFSVNSHRVKVKQKCYVYSESTFNVGQRMRLATNEELADQMIEEHAYSKYGRLRYKVKDGFITANPDFVQKIN